MTVKMCASIMSAISSIKCQRDTVNGGHAVRCILRVRRTGYTAPDAECIGALQSLQEGPYVSVVKGPRCVRVLKKESQKPVVR